MMVGLAAGIPSAQAADVTNLRCEYLVNPTGIDVGKPRLSWVTRVGLARAAANMMQPVVAAVHIGGIQGMKATLTPALSQRARGGEIALLPCFSCFVENKKFRHIAVEKVKRHYE